MIEKIKGLLKEHTDGLHTRSAKIGGYNLLTMIIALGILVAVNVLASSLPTKFTQFDISSQRLYSVTSNTKAVVSNLDQDVTIYWITQAGSEDAVIQRLLDVYDNLSDKITVEKKDPDVYPTFASQYTDDTVKNNSLVVVCGDKNRYIDYNDIYDSDLSSGYTSQYSSASYSFDGEGEITSALNYVVAEDLPQVYLTTGHGESELTDKMASNITRANLETQEFSLLKADSVPEEADMVIINSPTSDFSKEEIDLLQKYVDDGGKLLVFSGPQKESRLENLETLLSNVGVTVEDGIVLEADGDHYGFNYPYILIPDMQSSEITNALVDENKLVLVPLASGMSIGENNSTATVTSLLTTSDTSFSKVAGYDMSTSEKEDGDIDGSFSIAVSVEYTSGGKAIWISSDSFLDDDMISYSSGANSDFVMNAISWMTGDESGIAIASKSLDYTYLTISDSQAFIIKMLMLVIVPLGFLAFGIDEVRIRRKKQ